MEIYVTSVFVDDQEKALNFYTNILGFEKKNDVPVGEFRWLTVTGKAKPNGTELLLEPSNHTAVPDFKTKLVADGIPAVSFEVDNIDAQFTRLTDLGVEFIQEPMDAGDVKMAVLDDTCGNLVQLVEFAS